MRGKTKSLLSRLYAFTTMLSSSLQSDGVENGLYVVVAVGPFVDDVKTEVNFGARESDHNKSFYRSMFFKKEGN